MRMISGGIAAFIESAAQIYHLNRDLKKLDVIKKLISSPPEDTLLLEPFEISDATNSSIIHYHDDLLKRENELVARASEASTRVKYIIIGDDNGSLTLQIPNVGIKMYQHLLLRSGFTDYLGVTYYPSQSIMCLEHEASMIDLSAVSLPMVQDKFNLLTFLDATYALLPDNSLWLHSDENGYKPIEVCSGVSSLTDDVYDNYDYVYVVDAANGFAELDPILLGSHIESGVNLTAQVTQREGCTPADVLMWSENSPVLIDSRRIEDDQIYNIELVSTGTMIFNVKGLRETLTKLRPRKKRHVGGRGIVYNKFLTSLCETTEHVHEKQYVISNRNTSLINIHTHDGMNSLSVIFNGNR